jgi:hypothetical protein
MGFLIKLFSIIEAIVRGGEKENPAMNQTSAVCQWLQHRQNSHVRLREAGSSSKSHLIVWLRLISIYIYIASYSIPCFVITFFFL